MTTIVSFENTPINILERLLLNVIAYLTFMHKDVTVKEIESYSGGVDYDAVIAGLTSLFNKGLVNSDWTLSLHCKLSYAEKLCK